MALGFSTGSSFGSRTIVPDKGMSKSNKPVIFKAEFGDGYEQRIANGIKLTCNVGTGGAGGTPSVKGANGVQTVVTGLPTGTLTAVGGGGGGSQPVENGDGNVGGCGGGSSTNANPPGRPGIHAGLQGFPGGSGATDYSSWRNGGGGGGIGGAGTPAGNGKTIISGNRQKQNGGSGLYFQIDGFNKAYGGGGGGGGTAEFGVGGSGVGGTGTDNSGGPAPTGIPAIANRGSGGGGGAHNGGNGGTGSGGVVVIRYKNNTANRVEVEQPDIN